MSQLGDRLRALRKERDLTQEALARKAGTSLLTVARTELGYRPNGPRRDTVIKLARALDVPVSALTDEDDNDGEPAATTV